MDFMNTINDKIFTINYGYSRLKAYKTNIGGKAEKNYYANMK